MKVTKIEKQVKAEGRYPIFVDGKFAFGLSELGPINSGLKIGQEVSEPELAELKGQAEIDKAYNRALGLLARRPRSRWELQDYLKRKNYTIDQIAKILQILEERGFVNDTDFARRWVESRRLLKSMSKRKLTMELRQKRVDDSVIQQVLNDDEADEVEILKQLIAKKHSQTRYQDKTRLIRYLAGQGFSYGDIKQALSDKE